MLLWRVRADVLEACKNALVIGVARRDAWSVQAHMSYQCEMCVPASERVRVMRCLLCCSRRCLTHLIYRHGVT